MQKDQTERGQRRRRGETQNQKETAKETEGKTCRALSRMIEI
jgi:hypothetical protein